MKTTADLGDEDKPDPVIKRSYGETPAPSLPKPSRGSQLEHTGPQIPPKHRSVCPPNPLCALGHDPAPPLLPPVSPPRIPTPKASGVSAAPRNTWRVKGNQFLDAIRAGDLEKILEKYGDTFWSRAELVFGSQTVVTALLLNAMLVAHEVGSEDLIMYIAMSTPTNFSLLEVENLYEKLGWLKLQNIALAVRYDPLKLVFVNSVFELARTKLSANQDLKTFLGANDGTGNLWVCGLGDYWRLAQGHNKNVPGFSQIRTRWTGGIDFVKATCGAAHLIGLTEDGRVYTWDNSRIYSCGLGYHGTLGHGSENSSPTPREIAFFSDKRVVAAGGGNFNTAFLTDDGIVWTCGLNESGEIGKVTQSKHILIPEPVPGLPKIRKIFPAKRVWALSEDGDLYGWGDNRHGQLGIGTTMHQFTPVKLWKRPTSSRIVDITTGAYHTYALLDDGSVYGWGHARYLGIGARSEFIPKPRKIEFFDNLPVRDIKCGSHHTIVLTRDGNIYTWGEACFGKLGDDRFEV